MDAAQFQELLNQARLAGLEGAAQAEAEVRGALGQIQGQLAQVRQDQLRARGAGGPDQELVDRIDELERQLRPPADAGAGLQFAGRPARPPGLLGAALAAAAGAPAAGPVQGPGLFAGQLGSVKLQAPPNFTGSNSMDEWDNFSFKLKMYLGITMPHMVTNMEEAEEAKVFDYDTYQPELQEQARALMALLGSLCVDAAATFVRAQVEAGNRYDGYKLWNSLKNRFTLRQNLTQVGLLEQIMAWPINETNVRQELPKWESAIQKFENRSGQVLSDVLKIGFLRKNLGPTIKNHLRLN